MKPGFLALIGLAAILILSGCVQNSPQLGNKLESGNNIAGGNAGNTAGTAGGASHVDACPQGIDAWASTTAFGSPATQFLSSDSIFVTIKSYFNCDQKAKAILRDTSGNVISEQGYNIPQGQTGYKDYNPGKALAQGNYSFEIRYGTDLVKAIHISVTQAVAAGVGDNNSSGQQLSEQPNAQKYSEYFSSASLGKLPLGAQVGPPNFPQKATTFDHATDQLCTDMVIIKAIPVGKLATATYDVNNQRYSQEKTVFQMALQVGGTDGCETVPAAGKYERKIYVEDALAIVLPFEVK